MTFGVSLWVVWLSVAIALIVIEIFTTSAIALCLAIGASGGMIAALCGAPIMVQCILSAVVMIIALIVVPPLMRRYNGLLSPSEGWQSNMDALVGRECVVMITEPNAPGRVKIDGDRWQVRSSDGSDLVDGQRVRVIGHDSIILIVEPI